MQIQSWAVSDVGKKRDHNEDSIYSDDELYLYIVADGMGGHKAGATASATAISIIKDQVDNGLKQLPGAVEESDSRRGTQMLFAAEDPVISILTEAVQGASSGILDLSEGKPDLKGMGTTVVSLFFINNQAYFAHVGDSRLYMVRDKKIQQITTDHSLVQEQVDAGLISSVEAQNSTYKNVITRSVGFDRAVRVDCENIGVRVGDRFLLCSDGLSNYVSDLELQDILVQKDAETALQFFINLANSRGGDDNISAVLVSVSAD